MTTHSPPPTPPPDDPFFFGFPIFRSHHEQLETVYADEKNPNVELRTALAQSIGLPQPMIAAWFCLKRGSDHHKTMESELQMLHDDYETLKSQKSEFEKLKKELKRVLKENETLRRGHQIQKSLLKSFCSYQKDANIGAEANSQFQAILAQLDAPKPPRGFVFKKARNYKNHNERVYKEMEQEMEKMRIEMEQSRTLEQTYLDELEQKEAELQQKGAELETLSRKLEVLDQKHGLLAETTKKLEDVELADTVVVETVDEPMFLDVQVVEDTVVVRHL